MERIIDFNSSYAPPNPFIFKVNNGKKLSVLENEELTLNILSIGPETHKTWSFTSEVMPIMP